MDNELKEIAEFFKVLGDQTRLKIISLLIKNKNELCVGAIANIIGITQPAVSQHLRILKNMQLVEDTRTGYNIHYTIKTEAFKKYRHFFEEILHNPLIPENQECKKDFNTKECKHNE